MIAVRSTSALEAGLVRFFFFGFDRLGLPTVVDDEKAIGGGMGMVQAQ
jgi:hypothetical protein